MLFFVSLDFFQRFGGEFGAERGQRCNKAFALIVRKFSFAQMVVGGLPRLL